METAPNQTAPLTTVTTGAYRQGGLWLALLVVVLLEVACVWLHIDGAGVLVGGLALGSLYALFALGYTLVYGIIELINFAHGDVVTIGAFVSLTSMRRISNRMVHYGSFQPGSNTLTVLGTTLHLDLVWASAITVATGMIAATVICGVTGLIIGRLAYRSMRNAPRVLALIVTLGMSYIIESVLVQWKGNVPVTYPTVLLTHYYSTLGPVTLGLGVRNVDLIVIGAALVLLLGFDRLTVGTKLGRAMQAVAQDPEAALMMGVNTNRLVTFSFVAGSMIAGVGAVLYGMQQTTVTSTMGLSLALVAFTAAVLGGIGNIRGAVLGGLLIGIVKRFVDQLDKGGGFEWSDAVVFAILVAILLCRPSGLLGSRLVGSD